jgi:hypothetical protein
VRSRDGKVYIEFLPASEPAEKEKGGRSERNLSRQRASNVQRELAHQVGFERGHDINSSRERPSALFTLGILVYGERGNSRGGDKL